jgi:hypothetical protein
MILGIASSSHRSRIIGRLCATVLSLGLLTLALLPPIALADGETEDGASPQSIARQALRNSGRPANFYREVVNRHPEVCDPLLNALNEPGPAPHGSPLGEQAILLRNRYSVDWVILDTYLRTPVARAVVDIDNDGRTDVVYLDPSMLHSHFVYGLYVVRSYPEGETEYTAERKAIVHGPILTDTQWAGSSANLMIFAISRSGREGTIFPEPPSDLFDSFTKMFEVAKIDGRNYTLVATLEYRSFLPTVFVFDSQTRMHHIWSCAFSATYSVEEK